MEIIIKLIVEDTKVCPEQVEQFLIVTKKNIEGVFDLFHQMSCLEEISTRFFKYDEAYISSISFNK